MMLCNGGSETRLLGIVHVLGAAPLAERQVRPEGGDTAGWVVAEVDALRECGLQRRLESQQLCAESTPQCSCIHICFQTTF